MKNRNPRQELLNDVFASDVESSLVTVRRAARRRRWFRYGRMSAPVLLVIVFGCLLLREKRIVESRNVASAPSSVDFVTSSPLAAGFVVRSAGNAVVLVHNEASQRLVVTTERAATEPEIIDDERLLLIAPGAVLVRNSTGSADLVFPNPTELSSHAPPGFE